MKQKTILIGAGVFLILALGIYLGVKSGKIIEAIACGGVISGIAALLRKHSAGSGGKSNRPDHDINVDIKEFKHIQRRYRYANRKIQDGSAKSRKEINELRTGLENDRERIRGYEQVGSEIQGTAEKLDELIQRIQKEGINP